MRRRDRAAAARRSSIVSKNGRHAASIRCWPCTVSACCAMSAATYGSSFSNRATARGQMRCLTETGTEMKSRGSPDGSTCVCASSSIQPLSCCRIARSTTSRRGMVGELHPVRHHLRRHGGVIDLLDAEPGMAVSSQNHVDFALRCPLVRWSASRAVRARA